MPGPSTRHIEPLLPLGETHDLAASLTGTGSLAANVRRRTKIASSLTGTGSLTADPRRTAVVGSSLTGSGSLAAAVFRTAVTSADLSGVGSIAATIFLEGEFAAHLQGEGTLSATLLRTTYVDASLAGEGTLDAALLLTAQVSSTLTGAGTLTAGLTRGARLAASLVGEGTLTAELAVRSKLAANLLGVGTLDAELEQALSIAATLTGEGTLDASLRSTSPFTPLIDLFAEDLLAAATDALEETSGGLPARAFVTMADPIDACEQLTVRSTGIAGFPLQTRPIAAQPCDLSSLAVYKVRLVRCLTERVAGATPAEQADDAARLLEDGWALWFALVRGKVTGELFTSLLCPCAAVGVGPLVPVPKKGGMAGVEITVTVQADELASAASS